MDLTNLVGELNSEITCSEYFIPICLWRTLFSAHNRDFFTVRQESQMVARIKQQNPRSTVTRILMCFEHFRRVFGTAKTLSGSKQSVSNRNDADVNRLHMQNRPSIEGKGYLIFAQVYSVIYCGTDVN